VNYIRLLRWCGCNLGLMGTLHSSQLGHMCELMNVIVVNTHCIGVIFVSSMIVWMVPLVSILILILISILDFGLMVFVVAFFIVGIWVPMIPPLTWVLVLVLIVIP
jgi:hypothetical protein